MVADNIPGYEELTWQRSWAYVESIGDYVDGCILQWRL